MKKLLVVIDMQNDFIDGALGTKEAVAIVPKVKKKIEEYYTNGDLVVFTRDTHYSDYLETQEGRNLPVEHCIVNTQGWKISNELDTSKSPMIINKASFGYNSWNTFYFGNIESIELVGLCTDICVISNALIIKAHAPEIKMIVDASCCAGVTPESHKNALEAMKMCQINVIGE